MSTVCTFSQGPELNDLPKNQDELVYLATLAASGRRFEHMYDYVKRLVEILPPTERLDVGVRKYFSWACNAYVKGKRDSFRYVSKTASDCHGVHQRRADAAIEYRPTISTEIDAFCRDVVKTIDVNVLNPFYKKPRTTWLAEALLFYRTIKGDFLRYLTEVNEGSKKREIVREAYDSYRLAKSDQSRLPAANPTRLEMQLSLARFQWEVSRRLDRGFKTAREALESATQHAGALPSEETAAVLSRLRYFVSRWSTRV